MMRSECMFSFICHYANIDVDRLNRLLGDVVISQGGVVPHIAAVRPIFSVVHFVSNHSSSGTTSQQIKVLYISIMHYLLLIICFTSKGRKEAEEA
jgi:C-terminus of histone H2A